MTTTTPRSSIRLTEKSSTNERPVATYMRTNTFLNTCRGSRTYVLDQALLTRIRLQPGLLVANPRLSLSSMVILGTLASIMALEVPEVNI